MSKDKGMNFNKQTFHQSSVDWLMENKDIGDSETIATNYALFRKRAYNKKQDLDYIRALADYCGIKLKFRGIKNTRHSIAMDKYGKMIGADWKEYRDKSSKRLEKHNKGD